jgi:N-acetylneuraminic acid mutarotase
MKTFSLIAVPSLCLMFFVVGSCSTSVEAPPQTSQSAGQQGTWSQKAPLPIGISQVAVAAIGSKIYVMTGSTTDRVDHSINLEYDTAADRWRERAPSPRGLTHAAATALTGRIYLVGGFTTGGHGGAVNSVYEYNPATDAWRTVAPLRSPRGSVGVAALDGRIHAVGGRGLDKVTVTTHEVYDPVSGRWTDRAPLPTARDHFALIAANGRLHAIGGRINSPTENVDVHEIYNPATNSWTAGTTMPTARSGVAYALYQNFIVVAGGECRDKKTFAENEAYDLKTGRWVTLAPLPTARHAFRSVAVGRNLYFAGGASNCGGGPRSNELLVLTLP